MTAATFVISSLRNRLANPHPEVSASFLEPHEHFVPGFQLAHAKRASVRRYEPDRLGVLDNRCMAPAVRLRFEEQERPAFDLDAAHDHGARPALGVHREDLVPGPEV